MQKIPTVFKRDPENMKRVLPEVNPGCEWVLAGDGVATRKYDGTCCMFDGEQWWARREVKPGKEPPANFQAVETDETTGKTVGWEPMEQSAFAKWHETALPSLRLSPEHQKVVQGTYELCGPKINGNSETFDDHVLIRHGEAELLYLPDLHPDGSIEMMMDILKGYVLDFPYEGIVWHHPDGRMAKLKRRDFA
jgi:hypothetical protein